MVVRETRRQLHHVGQRVGGLERGKDSLQPRAQVKGIERLLIGDRHIVDAARVAQPRVLRPDAGVVEPGGDGMRLDDLAVLVLQQIGPVAVQHAR